MVHTLHPSQQGTASPRNFSVAKKAAVFPHACKRFLALLLHLLRLRFFFKKFRSLKFSFVDPSGVFKNFGIRFSIVRWIGIWVISKFGKHGCNLCHDL